MTEITEAMPRGEAGIRIRKLVGWGVIGQVSYLVSQFILLLALARFSTVEEVGLFGLSSAIIIPVFFFFNLGLRINQSTDIAREFSFREFLVLRSISTAAGYLLILIIAFVTLDPASLMVTIVFGAAKAAETFSDLFYGFFQRAGKIEYVARSLTLRGFGSALLFTAILAVTHNTAAAFLANLLVWVLVALFVDYLPARRLATQDGDKGQFRMSAVFALARSSWPLGINALVSALQGNLPRYIIGWTLGVVALGQFTVVSYSMQAVLTLTTAISNSISPRLAFYVSVGNRKGFFKIFHKFILLLALGGGVGSLACLVIGDWLIQLVFGAQYTGLGVLFAVCTLAATLRASTIILQSGLFATREFHLSMFLRIASLVVMFVICFAGVWIGGLTGLSWGIALSFFLHSVALWVTLQRIPFPPAIEKPAP